MAIQTDYKIGLKREVVNALKPIFGSTFPYEDLRGKVKVGIEYPMIDVQYPSIFVTYSEDQIRNAGIGHIEYQYDTNSIFPKAVKHWWFSGTLNFNILALNALDRDRLAAAVINAIAFGEIQPEFQDFWQELRDADYVALQPLTDRILTGGEEIGAVPWESSIDLQFGQRYSIPIFGEFYSLPETLELIQISEVDVYPYRVGEMDAPW